MADRMSRVWSPSTTLGLNTLTPGAEYEARLHPSTALELSQDRTMRDWTITRIVGNLQFMSTGATTFLYGIRLAPESEPLGMINPGTDQTVDWMLWGGIYVQTGQTELAGAGNILVDNRSQRKSRGMDSSLRLYVYNASGSTGYFAWTGRVLALFS